MQRLFRVGVALLIAWMPTSALAGDCGQGNLLNSRKLTLGRTTNSVLKAIEKRDIAVLKRYFDPRGVGFGVDQAPLTINEIEQEFSMRRGVYCLLFSTPCISSTVSSASFRTDSVLSKWTISYSEWLNQNEPYSAEVELSESDGSEMCGGLVTVRGRIEMKTAPKVLELQFVYANGKWLLSNTPYALGE